MASSSEFDSASERDGSTKMSIARSHRATSPVAGTKLQSSARPLASTRKRSSPAWNHSPRSAAAIPDRLTRAKASIKVPKSFSGRSAQTTPMVNGFCGGESRSASRGSKRVQIHAVITEPDPRARNAFVFSQVPAYKFAVHDNGIGHTIGHANPAEVFAWY